MGEEGAVQLADVILAGELQDEVPDEDVELPVAPDKCRDPGFFSAGFRFVGLAKRPEFDPTRFKDRELAFLMDFHLGQPDGPSCPFSLLAADGDILGAEGRVDLTGSLAFTGIILGGDADEARLSVRTRRQSFLVDADAVVFDRQCDPASRLLKSDGEDAGTA